MNLRFYALLCCGLFLAFGGVNAQDQTVVTVSYIPSANHDAEAIGILFSLIDSKLLEHDYTLNIDDIGQREEAVAESVLLIDFPFSNALYLTLLDSPLPQVSPILDEVDQIADGFTPVNRGIETAANLTTGVLLYLQNRCDLAEPYLEQALAETGPFTRSDVLNLYAQCAILAGDHTVALERYQSASRYMLDMPRNVNVAWVYFQLDQPEEAFEIMDGLVLGRANHTTFTIEEHADILSRRAQLYALALRYDEALADMDAAIALIPDDPALYTLRGNIRILIYEWDEVLADYDAAIELDPNYPDAYFYRGILYYTRTDYDPALTDFERYLELDPMGLHAEQAAQYAEEIRRVQAALDG